MIQVKVTSQNRIDIALSQVTEFSRSMIQKLIYAGHVVNNDKEIITKANYMTKPDEIFFIKPFESNLNTITKEEAPLDILFEDEYLIVINKNANTVTHPGAGNYSNTLMNHLAFHCTLSDLNGPEKLGVIHRLDKGVSGCIIFAKNNATHTYISEQFQNRTIQKKYLAICYNKPTEINNYVENYIARSKTHRQKMTIQESGKLAIMNFNLKEVFYVEKEWFSLIECLPKTGRMHQIRVQLANKKLPIIGDKLYSNKILKLEHFEFERIALHSSEVQFQHPTKGLMKITSPMPEEMKNLINILRPVC